MSLCYDADMVTDFSQGLTISSVFFALLNGFFSFISPCILPLIPSYLSYITGISYDDLTHSEAEQANRKTSLLHALCFVAGFSLIFVLLGASASTIGGFLADHLSGIRIVGGIFIIIMGILVMEAINIPFLQQEARLHLRTKPAGYAGTVVVGIVFGAAWTPCTGPFLAAVLAIAMESATVERGIALLSFYAIGLGVPFILSAIAINRFLASFKKITKYLRVLKLAGGIILILFGMLVLADKLTILVPR